jgi:hypothetical protein
MTHTEPVLEPAALAFAAAVGQSLPVAVHRSLVLAVHDKRNRFGEEGAARTVERSEGTAFQLELDGDRLRVRAGRTFET